MYERKKIGKLFTSKFVGNGPSSYKKRIYRAAVSQRFRNTAIDHSVLLAMSLGTPSPDVLCGNKVCTPFSARPDHSL